MEFRKFARIKDNSIILVGVPDLLVLPETKNGITTEVKYKNVDESAIVRWAFLRGLRVPQLSVK